jgi:hypothetical protein
LILEHISHNRLQVYIQCPRKYKYHYEDKIPSPLPKEECLEFGSFIHKLFELVVLGKSMAEALTEADKEHSAFSKSYRERIGSILSKFQFFNESINNSGFLSQSAEEKFDLTLGAQKIPITGTIDRKIKYNNKILIIDYKTSQKRNQVHPSMINRDKQLMTYIWATAKIENVPVENISGMLFYVESGDKLVCTPDPRMVTLYMFECENLAKKIIATKPETVRGCVSKLCNYCEYRNMCPDFKQIS